MAGLFAAAFTAATVLPFQSELIFAGLQITGMAPVWALILVASLGNTLGTYVNYWLGWRLESAGAHRWLRVPDAQFARARLWWGRWGIWTLLLSWMPVLDLTTVMAGSMRTPLWQFTLLVALAKTGRYIALAAITAGLFG
ncbi:MAG: DedA family protein [Rhodobacter sp.]|nr:DedA family protein [Paracoccaceae bacterium]MCC0079776.1 DedA family protein [Rhodobacter sp.]